MSLGVANAWVRGDLILGLGRIPSMARGNKELKEAAGHLHGLAANTVLIVAGLHALAGLFHHYVLKDGLVLRMMPQRRGH